MKVVLDTNFLIDLCRFKIDLAEIYDLLPETSICTLALIKKELQKIAKGKTKSSKYAKTALKLLEINKIKVLNVKETNTDKALLAFAVVATNDKALRKKLNKLGKKTIYLRAKKRIAMS